MGEKKCNKCDEVKPFSGFNKDKSRKDGHRSICRLCDQMYNEENKENLKEYQIESIIKIIRKNLKSMEKSIIKIILTTFKNGIGNIIMIIRNIIMKRVRNIIKIIRKTLKSIRKSIVKRILTILKNGIGNIMKIIKKSIKLYRRNTEKKIVMRL